VVDAPGDYGAAAGIGGGLHDRRGFHSRLTKRSISQIHQGLKPRTIARLNAALKRRSSTVHATFVVHTTFVAIAHNDCTNAGLNAGADSAAI
jgi:hypothetical protein